MRERRRPEILLLAALVAVAIGGCGGDHESSSSSTPTSRSTSTARPSPAVTGKQRQKTTKTGGRRLVPNRRRAPVERTVGRFVQGVERSDATLVCRLLGRPAGTLEGCARSAGIDLRAVPSSQELSVARISFKGSRASAKLSGGQTFLLRRAGRRWLVSGLRP